MTDVALGENVYSIYSAVCSTVCSIYSRDMVRKSGLTIKVGVPMFCF